MTIVATKTFLRRSNGRCAVTVEQETGGYRRVTVVSRCGRTSMLLATPRSVEEGVAIADKEMPRSSVHPHTLHIEPKRRRDGLIVETDIGGERLAGARRRGKRRGGR